MDEAGSNRGLGWAIVVAAALAVAGQAVGVYFLLSAGGEDEAASQPAPRPTPVPTAAPVHEGDPAPASPPPPSPIPAVPSPVSPSPESPFEAGALSPLERAQLLITRAEIGVRRRPDGRLVHGQDLRGARRLLDLALEDFPNLPPALGLMTEVELAESGAGTALPWARRAVEASPDDARVLLLRARVLIDLEQDPQAASDLERAWQLSEQLSGESRGLARGWILAFRARGLLQDGHFEEALRTLQQARAESPVPLAMVDLLVGFALHQGPDALRDHPRARSFYTRALRLDGRLADAWFYRGVVFFDLGIPEQAAADLDRAEELAKEEPHRFPLSHLRLVRGLAHDRLQHWEPAYDDLTAYLAEAGLGDPALERVRPVLARLAKQLDRPDPFQGAGLPEDGR